MNISQFDNVLEPAFCRTLIEDSSGKMSPATVGEGSKKHVSPGRTAYSYEFETPRWLDDRTKVLSARLASYAERLTSMPSQIVMYSPGCKFVRHRDANKKRFTAIYFLNEGYAGGLLKFDSGLQYPARTGSAVIWENTEDSYHEVTEVTEGSRYILAAWLI